AVGVGREDAELRREEVHQAAPLARGAGVRVDADHAGAGAGFAEEGGRRHSCAGLRCRTDQVSAMANVTHARYGARSHAASVRILPKKAITTTIAIQRLSAPMAHARARRARGRPGTSG